MPLSKRAESYFIAAGEVSGDVLGADLVLALRERLPKLNPFGVTGPAMRNAGVEEIASIAEFNVMGLSDVARKLPDLRLLESRLLTWIDRVQPRFAVLIDNPGFNLRLAEQMRMRGLRVFQYVAPKIWAWGAERAERIRTSYDLVLGILPFEADVYQQHGIRYEYVGSPLKDRIDKVIVTRESLGLPKGRPVIACLPGSRPAEVQRLMPILAAIRSAVAPAMPDAIFLVPMAPGICVTDIAAALGRGGQTPGIAARPADNELAIESWVVDGFRAVTGMSLEIMAASDVAVVTSGTATLECALLGTPLVVVYAMSEFTYQIARRAVKVNNVSLVNLMAGQRLVREYIQDVPPVEVAAEITALYLDKARRKSMCDRFEDIRDGLKGSAAAAAATAIATYFENSPTS